MIEARIPYAPDPERGRIKAMGKVSAGNPTYSVKNPGPENPALGCPQTGLEE